MEYYKCYYGWDRSLVLKVEDSCRILCRNTKPPEVKDTKKYNRAVAILWFVYAILLEIMGIPLLFLKQNSVGFIPVFWGTIAITIGLMVGYVFIEKKHRV